MNEYKEPVLPSEDWNKELIQDIFLSMYQMHLDGISQEERGVFFRACLRSHEYSKLLATYFKTPKSPSYDYEDFMRKLREGASTDDLLNEELAATQLKSKEPPPPPPETKWEKDTEYSRYNLIVGIIIIAVSLFTFLAGYAKYKNDNVKITECINQDPNIKDCPSQCRAYVKDRGDMPCSCYDATPYKDAPVRCVK